MSIANKNLPEKTATFGGVNVRLLNFIFSIVACILAIHLIETKQVSVGGAIRWVFLSVFWLSYFVLPNCQGCAEIKDLVFYKRIAITVCFAILEIIVSVCLIGILALVFII